jgi:dihydrolipoamide dehydrogenase
MEHDLCVIGAGWAGFNAALSAAKLGKKVCIIEENEIGGTCLNRGCIPTKALLQYSKNSKDISEIQKKKSDVVTRLKSGMSYMLKVNKVDFIQGKARIAGAQANRVFIGPDNKEVTAKFILIATGSAPKDLPQIKIDHKKIISSDDCLELTEVPKKLLIIGAGAIGCEFACFFKRLGSEVTIVEIAGEILPGFDIQVSRKLHQALQKAGITVHTNKNIEEFDLNEYDKCLLSVGRRAVTEGVFDDKVGIKLEKGNILADRELKTTAPGVFAAGDCIGGYMLAHVASYEGELATQNMFSKAEKRDYSVVPSSIFTTPEVAAVGITEEEAKKFGVAYKANTVHFLSVGYAHILESTDGFVKVIVEEKTGRILGASMIGLQATELVNIFSLLMKNNIPISGVKNTILAHPSVSEILSEAARTFDY